MAAAFGALDNHHVRARLGRACGFVDARGHVHHPRTRLVRAGKERCQVLLWRRPGGREHRRPCAQDRLDLLFAGQKQQQVEAEWPLATAAADRLDEPLDLVRRTTCAALHSESARVRHCDHQLGAGAAAHAAQDHGVLYSEQFAYTGLHNHSVRRASLLKLMRT